MTCSCGGELELRWKTGLGSRPVKACARCRRTRSLTKEEIRDLGPEEIAALPLAIPKRRPRPGARRRRYLEALRSPHWKKLRELVFERDAGRCQRCGEPATDLGHRTYERLGAELPEDVEAQCRSCNLREREQRIARRVLG